jgi:hypothetical protein
MDDAILSHFAITLIHIICVTHDSAAKIQHSRRLAILQCLDSFLQLPYATASSLSHQSQASIWQAGVPIDPSTLITRAPSSLSVAHSSSLASLFAFGADSLSLTSRTTSTPLEGNYRIYSLT